MYDSEYFFVLPFQGFDVDTDSDTTVVIQYSPRRKTNRVRKKKSPIQQVDESFEDSPPRRKTRYLSYKTVLKVHYFCGKSFCKLFLVMRQ